MKVVKRIPIGDNTSLTLVCEEQNEVLNTLEISVSGRCGFNSAINIADINCQDLIDISNALLQIADKINGSAH